MGTFFLASVCLLSRVELDRPLLCHHVSVSASACDSDDQPNEGVRIPTQSSVGHAPPRPTSASQPHESRDWQRYPQPRIPEMVYIPAATFRMGNPIATKGTEDYREWEHPQHDVSVDGFYLGRFLVTTEAFCDFLNEAGNKSYLSPAPNGGSSGGFRVEAGKYLPVQGAERCPAYPVTWIGATAYCEWLSAKLGIRFRLPTEAEWELAARGPELRDWPWGNDAPYYDWEGKIPWVDQHGFRWCHLPLGGFDEFWERAPVGSFPRGVTPQGAYDLMGYFFGQWCRDEFDPDSYKSSSTGKVATTQRSGNKNLRSVRGRYQVQVDRKSYRGNFAITLLLLPIPTDAKGGPSHIDGRSWSRESAHMIHGGEMFRLAASELP